MLDRNSSLTAAPPRAPHVGEGRGTVFWSRRGLGVGSPANQLGGAKDRLNKANDPADITAEGSTLNIDIPGRVQEKRGWSCQRGPDEPGGWWSGRK